MLPVGDFSRRGDVNISSGKSGYGSFLAPSLYFSSSEISRGLSNAKHGRVLVVTDKEGNRFNFPQSPAVFTPIKKNEALSSYSRFTPPQSSYYGVRSPSPSLISVTSSSETAETSMSSPFCMSPLPSSLMCYPSSSYSARYSGSYCSTPSGRHSRRSMRSPEIPVVTPTHRSPSKKTASLVGFNGTPNSKADDANRHQKIKTELCMHFKKGVCPYGSDCFFAHGEEELQLTTLMDWLRAGKVEDIETFRSKPCLTWVMTGSCPFGKRCCSIHDPRVTGETQSWLPLTETQGNSISTDINVEGLHQKRLHTILYDNPFGDLFSFELDDWADLYKLVCNMSSNIRKRRTNNLTELQKLSIVLQMRGGADWMYKYRPQHIIYDTLCMVLQKQAFRLDKSGCPVPIQISQYNPKNPKHVIVREIAFGPDSDPSVRPVALWFNIPDSRVSECTPQQAKRFRWKKKPKGEDPQPSNLSSMFESQDCFVMIRPNDHDAFKLATDILEHRYETLKADRLTCLRDRTAALKAAEEKKVELQEAFNCHLRHWLGWVWPVNKGRNEEINADTPVPPVDTDYNPMLDSEANYATQANSRESAKGQFVERVWKSFVAQKFNASENADSNNDHENLHSDQATSHRRLPIFAKLGYGKVICKDRSLPHIQKSRITPLDVNRRESERCWKALMLKNDEGFQNANEWEIVREHFQKASCKNSLTIIQQ